VLRYTGVYTKIKWRRPSGARCVLEWNADIDQEKEIAFFNSYNGHTKYGSEAVQSESRQKELGKNPSV
jgi:hypothetical protein